MTRAATLLLAMSVFAAHAQTATSNTSVTASRAAPTLIDSADRAAAHLWGLSVDDYRRSQTLMNGIRGAFSDSRITPIEVLGIHARDDAERRKYAEMFARLMAEDTERVLQFQMEYDKAFHRLYPKLVAMDLGAQRRSAVSQAVLTPSGAANSNALAMSRPPVVSAGDKLLVFTRDDCRECDEFVQHALMLTRHAVAVDVYLVGARSADDAQRVARRLAVDPALITAGKVTLNVDGGTFSRVLPQQQSLPAVVRKRGDSVMQLAPSEL